MPVAVMQRHGGRGCGAPGRRRGLRCCLEFYQVSFFHLTILSLPLERLEFQATFSPLVYDSGFGVFSTCLYSMERKQTTYSALLIIMNVIDVFIEMELLTCLASANQDLQPPPIGFFICYLFSVLLLSRIIVIDNILKVTETQMH